MRWVPWCLIILLAPSAGALSLVSIEVDFEERWDVADLWQTTPDGEVEAACTGGQPNTDTADVLIFTERNAAAAGDGLGVSPGYGATSCLEMVWQFNPPENATTGILTFQSTRTISTADGGTTSPPSQLDVNAPQYLALWENVTTGQHNQDVAQYQLFQPGDGSGVVSFSRTISWNAANPALVWHIEDQGPIEQETPSPLSMHDLTATVSDVRILYPRVAYAPDTQPEALPTVQNDTHEIISTRLTVDLGENATRTGLFVVVVDSPGNLTAMRGPLGTIDLADVAIDPESGNRVEFRVAPDVVREHGAGEYSFTFSEARAFPPPPEQAPPEPQRLEWVYFVAIAFSPFFIAGATYQANNFRRSAATEAQKATAVLVFSILGILALYYLFQVAYTWFVITLKVMTTFPLEDSQALTFYVQIVIVAMALGVLWLIIGRRLQVGLRRDLKEREQRAKELERSNAELEHFAYIASHDLQEPLRKVAGFTGLLKERYGDKLDDTGNEFMDYAVDGAERMQMLVQGLLRYSRAGRNGLDLRKTPLQTVAEQAVGGLEMLIEEKGAKVEVGELPVLTVDPILTRQVFQNLLGNALKFTDPDRPPRVSIRAAREEDMWRFEVVDNGIGIVKEHLDRVFKMFQRLNARDKFEGQGIGLALVAKIIHAHQGDVGVNSTPGQGSTFWFTLPDK